MPQTIRQYLRTWFLSTMCEVLLHALCQGTQVLIFLLVSEYCSFFPSSFDVFFYSPMCASFVMVVPILEL